MSHPMPAEADPAPRYVPPREFASVDQFAPPPPAVTPQHAPPVEQYAPPVEQYAPPVVTPQHAPPVEQYAPAPTVQFAPVVVHEPPPVVIPEPAHTASSAPALGRLDARDVSCWFSGRKVLQRCSLSMLPGRVTALIGPSGCGKSTFLRTLNRMHELVRGAELGGVIELDGVDIYGQEMSPSEVRAHIGMVFQKPNPFPAMSVADNVLAGLTLTGQSTSGKEDLVEQSLRRAGLWDEVKDRLNDGGMGLSGGQQQRLCIARALAVSPTVLLMDEPCSALDPISTRVIEETIRELCHDITIVIVTHNMQQAQRVSDDCAFFLVEEFGQPGRIVESGLTEQLFTSPNDPRTLDYVTGRFG